VEETVGVCADVVICSGAPFVIIRGPPCMAFTDAYALVDGGDWTLLLGIGGGSFGFSCCVIMGLETNIVNGNPITRHTFFFRPGC